MIYGHNIGVDDEKVIYFYGQLLTRRSCCQLSDQPPLLSQPRVGWTLRESILQADGSLVVWNVLQAEERHPFASSARYEMKM